MMFCFLNNDFRKEPFQILTQTSFVNLIYFIITSVTRVNNNDLKKTATKSTRSIAFPLY